ncbi:MAG TPA: hypothetical protein VLZ83_12055 [Edaphocola sp.]|nr:hypothetical protein [Edaphocola sp.]
MVLLLMLIFVFVLIGVLGIITAAYAYLNKKKEANKLALLLFLVGGIGTIVVTSIYTKKSLIEIKDNKPQKEVQRSTFLVPASNQAAIYYI